MHTITINTDRFQPVTPSESDVKLAGKTSKRLADMLKRHSVSSIHILEKGQFEESLELPESVAQILVTALEEISKGHAVTLIPMQEEVTTGQAAEILSVSRPFLVQMLNKGEIPFRKVGSRRRVKLQDIINYKRDLYNSRLQKLNELTAYDQELTIQ